MHPKYEQVLSLRRSGLSYREIERVVKISKSAISVWCTEIELSAAQKKQLRENQDTSRKRSRRHRTREELLSSSPRNPRIRRRPCLGCQTLCPNPRAVYCSNKCQQDSRYRDFIRDWLSGKPVKTHHDDINNKVCAPIRRFLIEKYQGKCAKCGWCEINPVTGKSPIGIDHIDGDSLNNEEKNLTLLCPNCHSLTPTYCSLNKGKGKRKRGPGRTIRFATEGS